MSIGLTDDLAPLGSFPLLQDTYLKGGYQVVADTTARDAIDASSRKEGMLVWVQADALLYQLGPGITNGDWAEFKTASASSLVLDLAAIPDDNVYNTLESVLAAANLLQGIIQITVLSSVSVSTGSYDFSNTVLTAGITGPSGNALTFTFLGTASITNLPLEINHVQLINQKNTGVWLTLADSPPPLIIRKNGGLINNSTAQHAINVEGNILDIYAYDDSVFTGNSSSSTIFNTTTATGEVNIYTLGSEVKLTNAFVFGGNLAVNIYYNGGRVFDHRSSNPFTSLSGTLTVNNNTQKVPFVITPPILTSSVNNYNPTGLGWADVLRISSNQALNITGLAASSLATNFIAKTLTITNIGSFAITLPHLSGSSTYPFSLAGNTSLILEPNSSVNFYFDPTSSYWRPSTGISVVPAVTVLTDGASIAVDASLGPHYEVTLGGNRTLSNPTNSVAGQQIIIIVKQDGTGGRTLAFGSNWVDLTPGTSVNLNPNAFTGIRAEARSFGGTVKWYYSIASDAFVNILTDAPTISINAATGENFEVTLGGNRTLANPTNSSAGKRLVIAVKQDATGGRTLAFDTNWVSIDSSTVLNPNPSEITMITAEARAFGGTVKWYYYMISFYEAAGGGEVNTASNAPGTGTGLLFKEKNAADLVFKRLKEGYAVSLTNGTDDITIAEKTTVTTLVDAATIAINADSGPNYQVTITANRTLGNPSNSVAGRRIHIAIAQDGTGGWTLGFASNWIATDGTTAVDPAPNAVSFLTAEARDFGGGIKWYYVVVSQLETGSTGEANTISNLGAGTGIYYDKVGVDLQLKSLVAGYNTALSATTTEITIDSKKSVTTLTDSANISINAATGPRYEVTIAGNRTLGNPTNAVAGQFISIAVKQDATGGRDLTFSSDWIAVDPSITLNQNPSTISLIWAEARSFGGAVKWYYWITSATDVGVVGEVNTASNSSAGTGTGLIFKTKDVADLVFKRLKEGYAVSLTNGTDDITIAERTTVVTLTDAATIAVDASLGPNYQVTLGGDRTLGNPTNAVAGQRFTLLVKQDITGNRLLSFGTAWVSVDPTVIIDPTPSSISLVTADARDFGGGVKWYFFISGLNESGSYGEANTATNLGAGTAIFASKVGVDLQFKSLVAGNNITLTNNSTTVTIAEKVIVTTLTDAATIAVDASAGPHYLVTLGGNRTLGNPTNPVAGKQLYITVAQDGVGSRTLAFDTDYISADGTATINPTASSVSIIYATARNFGSGIKWYYTVSHSAETGGGVVGPGSSTDKAIPVWNGVSGSNLSDSVIRINPAGTITSSTALTLATDTAASALAINIAPGAATGTNNPGSDINLTGGSPNGTGLPGSVVISGGSIASGTLGGNLSLRGGRGSTVANDGVIRIDRTPTDNRATRLQFVADDNTTISIKAPAAATSYALTLPTVQGAASTFLQNNGAGGLSWALASGGGGGINTLAMALQASTDQKVTLVTTGGVYFDPTVLSGPITFRMVGEYTSTDTGSSARVYLYDMGPGTGAFVPVRRSVVQIPYASAGHRIKVDQALTKVASPGVDVNEIHDSGRCYELRMYLNATDSSPFMVVNWAGLVIS